MSSFRGSRGAAALVALMGAFSVPALAADPLIAEVTPRRLLPEGKLVVEVSGPHGVTSERLPVIGYRVAGVTDSKWAPVDASRVHLKDFKPTSMTLEVLLPKEMTAPDEYALQLGFNKDPNADEETTALGGVRVVPGWYALLFALAPLALMLLAAILGRVRDHGRAGAPE